MPKRETTTGIFIPSSARFSLARSVELFGWLIQQLVFEWASQVAVEMNLTFSRFCEDPELKPN